jgi:PBSX family phage portal protein
MTDVVTAAEPAKPARARAFSLGEAEPIMNRREFLNHVECWRNGLFYEPPISMAALSRASIISPHHSSAITVKLNKLLADFIPHKLMSPLTFEGVALDFLALGNGYVERVPNRLGGIATTRRSLAKYTRRGIEEGAFFFAEGGKLTHTFEPGSVFQLMRSGLDQEIYGVPDYLSALSSAMLGEAAVLFRRRYYMNGSHAGFIMYVNEAGLSEEDADAIEEALEKSKGIGNFKNLFLHIPNGKEKGVQLIHPGEAAAKDEFVGIKNTTRDDILAAHRVPPQLLGVIPANAGGFGDVEKADWIFYLNEIVPLQRRFQAINEWMGEEIVSFHQRQAPA